MLQALPHPELAGGQVNVHPAQTEQLAAPHAEPESHHEQGVETVCPGCGGATMHDVATYGFEDLQLYRELTLPLERRSLIEHAAGSSLREDAGKVLRDWADKLSDPVQPKY